MKSFAKGAKKHLLGSSSKKKKQISNDEDEGVQDILRGTVIGSALNPTSSPEENTFSQEAEQLGTDSHNDQRYNGRIKDTNDSWLTNAVPDMNLDYKQSGDEDGGLSSGSRDWKAKYLALKRDHARLLEEHNKVLSQKDAAKEQIDRLQATLREKDNEIARLKNSDTFKHDVSNDSQDANGALFEAKRKISEQNEELQKLLEQRLHLETELSELRFHGHRSSLTPSDTKAGGSSAPNFEQERTINNLRTELKSKDDDIIMLQDELATAKTELGRVAGVMGVVAEQLGAEETKKKKTWWGKSKPRKMDPNKLSAADVDAVKRDVYVVTGVAGGSPSDTPRTVVDGGETRRKSFTETSRRAVSLSPQPYDSRSPDLAGVIVNKRMLELERENARLEGELEILHREKTTVDEQLKHAEAQIEILQKTLKNQDANMKAISVAKSLTVPLPREHGSETDQLRVVVQIQEAALQQLSLKNQTLEDTVKTYTRKCPMKNGINDPSTERLQQELKTLSAEASTLRQAKTELQNKLNYTQLKLGALEAESSNIKTALKQSQENSAKASSDMKKRNDTYAVMIGNLMKDNGILQEELSRCRKDLVKTAVTYQGEVRTLRDGRVERLKGDIPTAPVFPSPDTLLHHRKITPCSNLKNDTNVSQIPDTTPSSFVAAVDQKEIQSTNADLQRLAKEKLAATAPLTKQTPPILKKTSQHFEAYERALQKHNASLIQESFDSTLGEESGELKHTAGWDPSIISESDVLTFSNNLFEEEQGGPIQHGSQLKDAEVTSKFNQPKDLQQSDNSLIKPSHSIRPIVTVVQHHETLNGLNQTALGPTINVEKSDQILAQSALKSWFEQQQSSSQTGPPPFSNFSSKNKFSSSSPPPPIISNLQKDHRGLPAFPHDSRNHKNMITDTADTLSSNKSSNELYAAAMRGKASTKPDGGASSRTTQQYQQQNLSSSPKYDDPIEMTSPEFLSFGTHQKPRYNNDNLNANNNIDGTLNGVNNNRPALNAGNQEPQDQYSKKCLGTFPPKSVSNIPSRQQQQQRQENGTTPSISPPSLSHPLLGGNNNQQNNNDILDDDRTNKRKSSLKYNNIPTNTTTTSFPRLHYFPSKPSISQEEEEEEETGGRKERFSHSPSSLKDDIKNGFSNNDDYVIADSIDRDLDDIDDIIFGRPHNFKNENRSDYDDIILDGRRRLRKGSYNNDVLVNDLPNETNHSKDASSLQKSHQQLKNHQNKTFNNYKPQSKNNDEDNEVYENKLYAKRNYKPDALNYDDDEFNQKNDDDIIIHDSSLSGALDTPQQEQHNNKMTTNNLNKTQPANSRKSSTEFYLEPGVSDSLKDNNNNNKLKPIDINNHLPHKGSLPATISSLPKKNHRPQRYSTTGALPNHSGSMNDDDDDVYHKNETIHKNQDNNNESSFDNHEIVGIHEHDVQQLDEAKRLFGFKRDLQEIDDLMDIFDENGDEKNISNYNLPSSTKSQATPKKLNSTTKKGNHQSYYDFADSTKFSNKDYYDDDNERHNSKLILS